MHKKTHVNKREPIEHFPAKARRDGRFAKRINGHVFYFGKDGDRKAALREYDRVKYSLYEGRRPRPDARDTDGLALKQLIFDFLDDKLADAKAGKIAMRSYDDYRVALFRFSKRIGDSRIVSDIGADDFRTYARFLGKKLGGHAFNRERACIAAMFNHAAESEWTDRRIRMGTGFKKVPVHELRATRKVKLVPVGVVQACVREAGPQMRAMILLGCLGGYGPTDCSRLLWDHVDLHKGMIKFPRPKTKIERDTPLTKEMIRALEDVRADRPKDDLVFRTRHGNPWVHGKTDAVGAAWMKLQKSLQMQVLWPFYALRHTFATYAAEIQDRDARERILGHALRGLDDVYIESIFEPRMRKIVNHVRAKLLPKVPW